MNDKVRLPGWIIALLNSRKFWLAAMAVAAGVVLFARGDIDADKLVNLILVLVGVVIASIAVEDGAEKLGGTIEITPIVEVMEDDDEDNQFQG